MTFSCNQCQTRYHIADEKVRGKILQVRCRSCQNLVEVKDPELANARTPASAASMTLLGISAIPKESNAFAKPATGPSAALPAPSPSTARPASPMPAYAQPRPPQPAVVKPAPPMAPKPSPAQATPAYSTAQPSKPAVQKPAPIAARAPITSPTTRPPSLLEPKPFPNGAAPIPASIQPTPPPTEPKQWYYNRKGERQGPFRFSELTALITEGKVRAEDYAWSPEIVSWKQVKDIELFASYLPAEPPPFEAATLLPLPPKPQVHQPPKPPPTPESPPASLALPPIPTRAPSQPFMAAVQAAPPIPVRAPSQPYLPVVQPPQMPSQPYLPVIQPVQTREPSQPYLPVVQAPQVPQAPSAPPAKPPTIVKAQIAVQPSMPGPSPSAAVLQTSMMQPAGPTSAASNMFAASGDIFAGVPDAADFKAAPIREMSAIIPISAMKPPLRRRLMVPALVGLAFVGVAILAFSFGQGSNNQTLVNQQKDTEETPEDSPKTNFSDLDIKGLDGLDPKPHDPQTDPSNPKNHKNNKKDPDPIASLGNPDKKNTAVDAKTAAENAKAADLFSGKKTAVTPTLTPENKTNTEPEPVAGGSEKVAMQLVNETNIKPCIDRAFTNGDLRKETRLNISLKTDANGKISSFSVGNAPAGSSLENCLKSAYSRAPLKEAGGAVSLSFPIIASPSF